MDEIHERLMEGQSIDLEPYIEQFPEHADELRKYATTMMAVMEFGGHPSDQQDGDKTNAPVHRRVGEFTIVGELGRGGMGIVYEALQGTLGRRVALKILPYAAFVDEVKLKRFQNEARAAASLHHPNIVPIHSVGSDKGVHFYAMQLISGPSVADLLQQLRAEKKTASRPERPKDQDASVAAEADTHQDVQAAISTLHSDSRRDFVRTTMEWTRQAAEGLAHAHENGVLHRDIKPANLLIDQQNNVWITDFGLARLESDASITATGDLIGTVRYMPPEVVSGKRVLVDHRADIYSLGLTMYEMLTLSAAFPGDDREHLIRQIMHEDPVPLRRLDSSIPPELEIVFLKATEKQPQDRYGSAQEFADDLQRILDDRPILARPPSLVARALKWAARHRAAVISTGVAAFFAMVVSLAVLWQTNHAIQGKNRELLESQQRSQRSLNVARKALDDVYVRFSLEWLADKQAMTPAQRDLIINAASSYEELLSDFPDDRDLMFITVDLLRHAASLHDDLAEDTQSRRCLESAAMIMKQLGSELGDDPRFLRDNAKLRLQIAGAHRQNRGGKQRKLKLHRESAREAHHALDRYVATAPEDLRSLAILSFVQQGIALLEEDPSEKERMLLMSIESAEQVLRKGGETTENLAELSQRLFHASEWLRGPKRAVHAQRQVDIARRLFELQPNRRLPLAKGLLALGKAKRVQGQLNQAESLLLEAIDLFAYRAAKLPNQVKPARDLSLAHLRLALVYQQQQQSSSGEQAITYGEKELEHLQTARDSVRGFADALRGKELLLHALLEIPGCYSRLSRQPEALTALQELESATESSDDFFDATQIFRVRIQLARWNRGFSPQEVMTLVRDGLHHLEGKPTESKCYLQFEWHPDESVSRAAYVRYLDFARAALADSPDNLNQLHSIAGVQVKGPFPSDSDFSEALRLIQRANELAPNRGLVVMDYGWALYRLERYAEAVEWFKKAEEAGLFRSRALAVFGMALTKLRLQDVEAGRTYYQRGIELLRPLGALNREETTILKEAAAAFEDEKVVHELLNDRWPGISASGP